jgi:hypothetical protein
MWEETLPYREAKQQNFICSFCDILPAQANYHRECYGKHALALTKTWGIIQNVAPVRYVHETSVGVSPQYQSLKLLFRSVREVGVDQQQELLTAMACFRKLHDAGILTSGNFAEALKVDPFLISQCDAAEKSFVALIQRVPAADQREILGYFYGLFRQVVDLHNELESRDAFVRAYKEDFTPFGGQTIMGKVLYDEREWRSVKMIGQSVDGSHDRELAEAIANKYLPVKYNLSFRASDLQWVVVENGTDKKTILDFLAGNRCLVSGKDLKDKLVTFEEFERM